MRSDSPYPRPPLALIVTAQEWTALSVITIFSPRGYATLRVVTAAQAMERVRETPIDLLIVDADLRDMPAAELAARLRERGYAMPLVILATELWEREARLAALRAGAWDICQLPMDSEEMFLRVDHWVRSKLQSDVMAQQGLLDPQTGLYNVQGLLRRVGEIAAGATRHERPLACVVVSAVVRTGTTPTEGSVRAAASALAEMLREAGRASDAIGRLSETEFVVMAPDTDFSGVQRLAERLRQIAELRTRSQRAPWDLRFGCYAVPNMKDAPIAPSELLIRAAEALRSDTGGESVGFFPSPIPPSRPN